MDFSIVFIVYGILFLGELGDKTQLIVFNISLEPENYKEKKMLEVKAELESLFKGMLEEVDYLIEKKDEILLQDLKDYNMKIQWFINGIKGYQIFQNLSKLI